MIQSLSVSIADLLPQTYPFILIDIIQEFEKGKSLKAVKNIAGLEWCFRDHQALVLGKFPETLIIESASQAAILLYRLSGFEINNSEQLVLSKIKAEFKKEVFIGDQLLIEVSPIKMLEKIGLIDISISVNNEKMAVVQIVYSKINHEHKK